MHVVQCRGVNFFLCEIERHLSQDVLLGDERHLRPQALKGSPGSWTKLNDKNDAKKLVA